MVHSILFKGKVQLSVPEKTSDTHLFSEPEMFTIEVNTYKWQENPNASQIHTERSNHTAYTAHHAPTSNSKRSVNKTNILIRILANKAIRNCSSH